MSWSGFHRLDAAKRLARVAEATGLSVADQALLQHASALPAEQAGSFIENAVGSYPLPLGFAVGFQIDGRDVVVPMAVEESSVLAAASHGAKLAAQGGGFVTEVDDPITVAQIELRDLPDIDAAKQAIARNASEWMGELDASMMSMVERGGGMRAFEARVVGSRLVVHLHVDTRDSMGANLVNTLAERAAPWIAEATGGTVGLRILTNLADTRLASASCTVPAAALGGTDVVAGMVAANDFAVQDPYRAATHNKGIMNGIDPVVIATGNDWRAIEAGAHAYAAHEGHYRALTHYAQADNGDLEARLVLPMAVGTVGGVTKLHPVAQACLRVLGSPDARRLAGVITSVGLAQNISALRALSQEGIQEGHMALHARNLALQAGAAGAVADQIAAQMVAEGAVTAARARQLADRTKTP